MEKLVPYVNLQTEKDSDGKITRLIVRTVSYLPQDSNVPKEVIEGPVADNIIYRPLTIPYDGTSETYDYFGCDFIIERKDVGLLERGVNVKVVSKITLISKSATAGLGDPDDEGIIIDY